MSDHLYVGTRKGLFELRRNGGWDVAAVHFLGDPVCAVLPLDDGGALAALDLGHFGNKLWRRDAPDAEWREVAVPVYPEKPADDDDKNSWSLELLWCLEAGAGDAVWAGTIPGGLFLSPDGGESWDLVRSLWDRPERKEMFGGGFDQPGIHSVAVDPRDSNRLLLGISCGGAWLSDDGGETWRLGHGMTNRYMPPERRDDPVIQDAHRIVRCPAAPEVCWCQHHDTVFRSTDGGETWAEVPAVQPSTFGFAVAVHPQDPDTAWFVPAVKDECRVPVDGKVVVARTRDGGKNFDVLTDGLPQRHAYDLVLRHALDIDETGATLAFGSTSGGLWFSEDGGDSWSAPDMRLPPVACVRFAD